MIHPLKAIVFAKIIFVLAPTFAYALSTDPRCDGQTLKQAIESKIQSRFPRYFLGQLNQNDPSTDLFVHSDAFKALKQTKHWKVRVSANAHAEMVYISAKLILTPLREIRAYDFDHENTITGGHDISSSAEVVFELVQTLAKVHGHRGTCTFIYKLAEISSGFDEFVSPDQDDGLCLYEVETQKVLCVTQGHLNQTSAAHLVVETPFAP